jgi:hypothetical protein
MSLPGIELGPPKWEASTSEKNHSNSLLIAIRNIYLWPVTTQRVENARDITFDILFHSFFFKNLLFMSGDPGGQPGGGGEGPGGLHGGSLQRDQDQAQPGANPSPGQWIRRWVFMIIFFYQEDQWSQHIAQPGANPSPRQWIRRWVFMIIFFYQEDQWSQHTLLSQEPIALLDNGSGESYDHLY